MKIEGRSRIGTLRAPKEIAILGPELESPHI